MSNNGFNIEFTDNSAETLDELNERIKIALREVGREAEGIAKENCTAVDTGRLRNSITFATADKHGQYSYKDNFGMGFNEKAGQPEKGAVYIGTNVEYAPYIELGHKIDGQKKVPPSSRPTRHGNDGSTSSPPLHFLKNAAANHTSHYKKIISEIMKKD